MNNVNSLLEEYMKDYYNEVIVNRAIPSVEDGLKPIHRRLLYAFYESGRTSSKPYTKSVIASGEALKYSPHSDTAAYDAAITISCFSNNQPLIDFHGGNKTIYGQSASASRYTEMRLSKFSEFVLLDKLDKKYNSVVYVPNFDQSKEEPFMLPSKIPMFLLNGHIGMAGGFMSSMLPHSIDTIVDKTIQLIDNPDIDIDEYIKDFLPSFPTGGTIVNKSEVIKSYKTPSNIENKSSGNCILRGKTKYVKNGNYISIYEIPFYITCDTIIEEIKKEVKEGNLKEISSIKNLSAKGDIDIQIHLKRGADENVVLNKLYDKTSLQSTIPIVNILTHHGEIKIYNNVKEMINDWLNFRISTIKRIYNQVIKDLNYDQHIKEGLFKICSNPKNIDILLKIVRNSKLTEEEIFNKVRDTFDLSEKQTEYIVNTKIIKLSNVSIKDLNNDITNLQTEIDKNIKFISNNKNIKNKIKEELLEVKKKFGKPLYKFITDYEDIKLNNIEDTIEDEDFILMLTKSGYLKKISTKNIKSQKRNGKGNSIGKLKNDDVPLTTITANSKDSIMLFTNDGYMYIYKCYELPNADLNTIGKNILGFTNNKQIISMVSINNNDINNKNAYILTLSKFGKIKMTPISEFISRFNKIIAVKYTSKEDQLVFVKKIEYNENNTVLIANKEGFIIHSNLSNIPILKRTTQGKNSFSTGNEIEICSCDIIDENTNGVIFVYSNGLAKRISTDEIILTNLNCKGKKTGIKENTKLVSCLAYTNENDVLSVISNKGNINIRIDSIPLVKRIAYGSNIKKLADDEYIIDAIIIDGADIENKKAPEALVNKKKNN